MKNSNIQNIQGFLESMAGQFQAGRKIAKENSETFVEQEGATKAIERDIDSFCVDAAHWFGKDFDEKKFREIALAN